MYTQIPALLQRAIQLFQQGEIPQAQANLEKLLQAQPRHFDALHVMGVIKAMAGQREDAIELFRKALAQNKNHSFLQFNLAKALSESGRDEEALVHHKRASQLAPAHLDSWINFGISLRKLDRNTEALDCFLKATALNPESPVAWNNVGVVQQKLGLTQEALAAFDKALSLQPNFIDALINKSVSLDESGSRTEALRYVEEALALDPHLATAWNAKGVVLAGMDRDDQALACYEKAMGLASDWAEPALHKAHLLLRMHQFEQGWALFESRWAVGDLKRRPLDTSRPRWAGDASDGPLLLWGEQGIGDQVLYASILPELATLPQKKHVALDKRLIPLFQRSMTGFDFVDLAAVSDALDFAVQLPLGSLPRLFRPDLASFSRARHPYLRADADRSVELRGKIAQQGRLICGVSWVSKRPDLGHFKSMDLAQMLLPLASPRLHFVDLQYGDTAAERQTLQQTHGIEVQHLDEVDNFNDIDGLASLIQACDVVVTTSNSTAHLAGALGKRTLLLLPSGKGQLWYWAEINSHIPWYPSIQAFRQQEVGNWHHPLQAIKAVLEKL
ncbi:MAG: tetratricopeptide repeat protein [Hylemonella sp.]|uniref:tetratricopeptide repeat protein n=1 Tax=Hylemonella sp. TaxID=2066020 RepID=UPI0022C24F12|nr:tetratricopeptide repeat protein [Hylemonella sp.]MCZ8253600.1 tetratricopeptide repeat protein [Hylemonella sp.]